MNDHHSINYPTKKVIACYALLGGLTGGLLCGSGLMLTGDNPISNLLPLLFYGGIFGTVLGFIPAIMTGIILSQLSALKNTLNDYLIMFAIGSVVSLIFGLCVVFALIFFGSDDFSMLIISVVFALLGGVSSMVVGSLVLPKSLNKENQ